MNESHTLSILSSSSSVSPTEPGASSSVTQLWNCFRLSTVAGSLTLVKQRTSSIWQAWMAHCTEAGGTSTSRSCGEITQNHRTITSNSFKSI